MTTALQWPLVWSPWQRAESDRRERPRSAGPRRARGVAALAAFALVVSGTVSVEAQDSIEDARDEQERVREEKAEAAAELDAAQAEDAEVAAALRDITDIVNAQQGEVDEAQRLIDDNRAAAAAAEAEVAAALAEEEAMQESLATIAVAGFVSGGDEQATFLSSSDPTEALRQSSLLDQANVDTVEVLEELRIVQEDRLIAEAEAAAAVEEAERIEEELALKLVDYEEQQGVQAVLKAELEARVAEWEAEVADFEAEDDRLAAFIRTEEAKLNPPTTSGGGGGSTAPAPGTPSVSGFQWPINAPVSSGFGYRVHPIFGTKRLHKGVDMGAGSGTPIAAAKDGTVLSAGWQGGYGNTVVISHGDGITTLYAHQSSIAVSAGQQVSRGDIIGYVGSTGWSTGPHLHFEVRVNGTPVDPMPYMP